MVFSNHINLAALASLAQLRVNAGNSVSVRILISSPACVQRGGSLLIRNLLLPGFPPGPRGFRRETGRGLGARNCVDPMALPPPCPLTKNKRCSLGGVATRPLTAICLPRERAGVREGHRDPPKLILHPLSRSTSLAL